MQQAEPHTHVDPVNTLGLIDRKLSEAFMFVGLAFDVVLDVSASASVPMSDVVKVIVLTPIGLAAVRITRDSSLNVRDMLLSRSH